MNPDSEIPPTENHPNVVAGILKRVGEVAIQPVLMAVVFFLASGRLDWTWAWVYLGINLASVLIVGLSAIRTHPETVADPGEVKTTEKWDIGSIFYLLVGYVALPLVAGLDVRFGWAPDLRIGWHVVGAAVLAVGWGFAVWAMTANPYIWSAVPIQDGQTVCCSGPYGFVRHPGYAGLILQSLGAPVLLGSLWALIPGITAAVLMIIATSAEDRLLQAELPGYQDYVQQVRFRLVPGIW